MSATLLMKCTYIHGHTRIHAYILIAYAKHPYAQQAKSENNETRIQKNSIVSCRKTRPQLRQCMPGKRRKQKPRRAETTRNTAIRWDTGTVCNAGAATRSRLDVRTKRPEFKKVHSFLQQTNPQRRRGMPADEHGHRLQCRRCYTQQARCENTEAQIKKDP